MAVNVGPNPNGSNVIAQGRFFHAADATPDGFFTHWSVPSSIGTVTISVANFGTVLTVRILRFSGPAIVLDIGSSPNTRSVTVGDAQALQIQEETVDVSGEYYIVKN